MDVVCNEDEVTCQEGCFCDEGFVSIGDTCILRENCGCILDGLLYNVGDSVMSSDCSEICECVEAGAEMICHPIDCEPVGQCQIIAEHYQCLCSGQTVWNGTHCEDDEDECKERTHNCDENAVCTNTIGGFECTCCEGFNGDGTTCEPKAQCLCKGDPHVYTFDNLKIGFQGTCQYVLVQDGCTGGVHTDNSTFIIKGDFWRDGRQRRVSFLKSVYIEFVGGMEIALLRDRVVEVNGVVINHFPASPQPNVIIKKTRRDTKVVFDGIIVTWNGLSRVRLNVPDTLQNSICGLCGDYNGNKLDELRMGDTSGVCPAHPLIVQGQMTTVEHIFGVSWLSAFDDDVDCHEDCTTVDVVPETCDGENLALATPFCSTIFNVTENALKDCLLEFSSEKLQNLLEDCLFDACMTQDYTHEALCSQLEDAVQVCRNDFGLKSVGWRDQFICPMDCPDNMEYSSCGPSCPSTCFNLECLEAPCQEGCFCLDGYMADGDSCILPEDCGCLVDGVVYQNGEAFTSQDGLESCTCIDNSVMC